MLNSVKKSLLRILGLIKKEFITLLVDPSNRKVLTIPIVVQCVLFGYGASFILEHVPFVFFCQSNDETAHRIIVELESTPRFELVKDCDSIECVRESVDKGESLLALYFPPDFKNTGSFDIMLDARNTSSANTVATYVNKIIQKLNYDLAGAPAININTRYLFNQNNYTRYTILVGMRMALSVIQVLLLSSLSISKEREEGSYDMMIMTPARPFEMLIGKAVPPVIIAIVQSLALVAICRYYFEIPIRGSVFDLLVIITVFSIAVVGIGLVISAFSKTTMLSLIVSFTLCLVIIMTSGLITAVDAMPEGFQTIAYINPLYYGISQMWQCFLEGKTLADVFHLMLPLIGIGTVTLSIAGYIFKHNLE